MSDKFLPVNPYKGTRDFYPENMAVRNWFFAKMRTVVEKDYAGPDISLTFLDTTGDNPYDEGFDRFGRIIKQEWTQDTDTLFDIRHAYDGGSNRTYADRQVYKGHSQHYSYDSLNRLTAFKAGKINSNKDDIVSHWLGREQGWTLNQVGNQTAVKDFGTVEDAEAIRQYVLAEAGRIYKLENPTSEDIQP